MRGRQVDQRRVKLAVQPAAERSKGPDLRPSLEPGRYFRLLLVGYIEGLDAERASHGARPIRWRFVGLCRLGIEEAAPDHSTISRTRRLIDVETHRAIFTWIQQRLVTAGLLKGQTIAIDGTTLEANAAMRSIKSVRRLESS